MTTITVQLRGRWPAYGLAVLFLGYAVGKAALAARARLGFPGGPPVSAAETGEYFLDPAVAQWFAAGSGVLAAGIVLATVLPTGHRPPPLLLAPALGILAAATCWGGGVMVLDPVLGLGVGWPWPFAVPGAAALVLVGVTIRTYARELSAARLDRSVATRPPGSDE